MTLLQIVKFIKDVAYTVPNVHSVVDEFLDLNDSAAQYGAVILQQRNHTRNNDFTTYGFYLGYADRLNEDKSNLTEVQSTAIQVIDSIVYMLENKNLDVTIGTFNTFTQRFDAEAAGGYVELNVVAAGGECLNNFARNDLKVDISKNGTYTYIPKGLNYTSVRINANVKPNLQDKTISISTNGTTEITYDASTDYNGLDVVTVTTDVHPTEKLVADISTNGTHSYLGEYAGAEINVNVPNELADIGINPMVTKQSYTPNPDDGFIGYKTVTVSAVTSTIDSNIKADNIKKGVKILGVTGTVDTDASYDEGYTQGESDQKAKLTDLDVTTNGTYTKEDGYKSVTVAIDTDSYYNDGYSQGTSDQKAKLTDLDVTKNGTYESEDGYKSVVVDVAGADFDKYKYLEFYADKSALRKLGWTEDDIKYYMYNCGDIPSYMEDMENLTDEDIEISLHMFDSEENWKAALPKVKFLPKIENTDTLAKYGYWPNSFESLKGVPLFDWNKTSYEWSQRWLAVSTLKTIPPFDFSNVTGDFSRWLESTESIYSLPDLNLSKVTNFTNFFAGCGVKYLPNIDMSSALYCDSVFASMHNLLYTADIHLENADHAQRLFNECSYLIKPGVLYLKQSNVECYQIFRSCRHVKEVTFASGFTSTNVSGMFIDCSNLKTISILDGTKISLKNCTNVVQLFHETHNLSRDSFKCFDFDMSSSTNCELMFFNTGANLDESERITSEDIFTDSFKLNPTDNFKAARMFNCTANFTWFPALDYPNCTDWGGFTWDNTHIRSVKSIDMSGQHRDIDTPFRDASLLQEIRLSGPLNGGINWGASSVFSRESIKSMLEAAANTEETTSSKTMTLNNITIYDYADKSLTNLIATAVTKGWTFNGLTVLENASEQPFTVVFDELSDSVLTVENSVTVNNACEYSTDLTNWTSAAAGDTITTDNVTKRLYLRATGDTFDGSGIPSVVTSSTDWDAMKPAISVTSKYSVEGNILSLLYGSDFASKTTLPSGTTSNFAGMFVNETNLISAEYLLLPSNVNSYIYALMFSRCTSLTTAPELPATTLANNCYMYMFYRCTSLTTAPELPATTLANYCYQYMFSACTSLTTAPDLPATNLYRYSYDGMFNGCKSLINAPIIAATTGNAGYCCQSMFSYCTSLVTGPELKFTELIYSSDTPLNRCQFKYMFLGCSSLESVKVSFINITTGWTIGDYPFDCFITDVKSGGILYRPAEATYNDSVFELPSSWTVETY